LGERSVLELRDVVCRYGQMTALKEISLTVGKGQLVALIGATERARPRPRSISGLLHPTAGSIVFEGTTSPMPRPRDPFARNRALRKGVTHSRR
jgi:branched-chain amino acid transport system ATP-binding protein